MDFDWSDVGNAVADMAPAIGSVLLGPVGAAAGSVLASIFGTEDKPDAVMHAIRNDPEAAVKLRKAELEYAVEMRRLAIVARTQQIEVNKAEAQSDNVFVSGWRPAVGWTCAAAFGWTFVLQPFAAFALAVSGADHQPLPELSLSQMMPVLIGMLGLGGFRSFEKFRGVKTRTPGQ